MATSAEPPAGGTVYEGPAVPIANPWVGNRYVGATTQTVYEGAAPTTETVFDEASFVPKRIDNTVAVNATRRKARMSSLRFFIIAGISALEASVWASRDLSSLAMASGIVAVFFAVLAVFAFRMNKTAFLIGAAIYALNSVYLLMNWNPLALYAMVVRAIIAWRLYCMYDLIRELETD